MSLLVPGLNPAFSKPPPKAKPAPKPATVGGHFGPGGEILPGPAPKTTPPKHSSSSSPPKHSTSGGCFGPGGIILPASQCGSRAGTTKPAPSGTPYPGQKTAPYTYQTGPGMPTAKGGCFGPGGVILPASQCGSRAGTTLPAPTPGYAPPQTIDCLVEGSPGCIPHTTFCQRYPSSCAQNNSYCAKYPTSCATGANATPTPTQAQLNWIQQFMRNDGHNWIVEAYPAKAISGFATDVYVAHDYGANVPPNSVSIYTTGLYTDTHSAEVLFAATNAKHPFTISPMHALANAVRIPGENTDLTKITDGIYAVPFGIPVHKFNMKTTLGHHYTTGVMTDDKTYTTYYITDKTVPATETWTHKGVFNYLWGKKKVVRNGDEWWNQTGTKGPFAVRYDIRAESPTRYYTMTNKGLVQVDPGPSTPDRQYRISAG